MKLCGPALQTDGESLNARLTRLEEQIASGKLTVQAVPAPAADPTVWEDEQPPFPGDLDAPDAEEEEAPAAPAAETPAGFWPDLVSALRAEFQPPVRGFFAVNGPITPVLKGDVLTLAANSEFVKTMISPPEVLQTVGRKASALLGRPIRAVAGLQGQQLVDGRDRLEDVIARGSALGDRMTIK